MNNLTFMAECRDHTNTMTGTQGNDTQSKAIRNLHNLSQIHMNSTCLFIHQHLSHVCIIFSDRALKSMLQALYMKENNSVFPPHSLSLEDVMELTELDTVLFIHSMHFLASLIDISLIEQMESAHLKRLMQRVDDVLIQLSARVTTHPSEQYHSIF